MCGVIDDIGCSRAQWATGSPLVKNKCLKVVISFKFPETRINK